MVPSAFRHPNTNSVRPVSHHHLTVKKHLFKNQTRHNRNRRPMVSPWRLPLGCFPFYQQKLEPWKGQPSSASALFNSILSARRMCRLQRVKSNSRSRFPVICPMLSFLSPLASAGNKRAFSKPAPLLRFVYATQRQYIRLKMPCQFLMGWIEET